MPSLGKRHGETLQNELFRLVFDGGGVKRKNPLEKGRTDSSLQGELGSIEISEINCYHTCSKCCF